MEFFLSVIGFGHSSSNLVSSTNTSFYETDQNSDLESPANASFYGTDASNGSAIVDYIDDVDILSARSKIIVKPTVIGNENLIIMGNATSNIIEIANDDLVQQRKKITQKSVTKLNESEETDQKHRNMEEFAVEVRQKSQKPKDIVSYQRFGRLDRKILANPSFKCHLCGFSCCLKQSLLDHFVKAHPN